MGTSTVFVPVGAPTLAALRRDPDNAEAMLYPDEDAEVEGSFYIDKAWHGLHYLLTGSDYEGEPPLRWAIMGDQDLGADLGMGGSSFLTPGQVREVAAALAGLTPQDLRRRYDPQKMQALRIYPDVMWVRDGEGALAWAMERFAPLVQFYADASARGDAVVLYQT